MTSTNGSIDDGDADRSRVEVFERSLRPALGQAAAAPSRSATVDAVMRRIGGRSPEGLAQHHRFLVLRSLSAVAAAALLILVPVAAALSFSGAAPAPVAAEDEMASFDESTYLGAYSDESSVLTALFITEDMTE